MCIVSSLLERVTSIAPVNRKGQHSDATEHRYRFSMSPSHYLLVRLKVQSLTLGMVMGWEDCSARGLGGASTQDLVRLAWLTVLAWFIPLDYTDVHKIEHAAKKLMVSHKAECRQNCVCENKAQGFHFNRLRALPSSQVWPSRLMCFSLFCDNLCKAYSSWELLYTAALAYA